MVSYWDTSAIVPLLVSELETEARESQLLAAEGCVTWWGTRIEAISALCRRVREGSLSEKDFAFSSSRLEGLRQQWTEVVPSAALRNRSERLLRLHPLRAADALQLAAALMATEEQPEGSTFHTSDQRLAETAKLEGFTVV